MDNITDDDINELKNSRGIDSGNLCDVLDCDGLFNSILSNPKLKRIVSKITIISILLILFIVFSLIYLMNQVRKRRKQRHGKRL